MKQVTIHNLAESTAQEVYDFICAHLEKQDRQSHVHSACRNRVIDEDGTILKCAAGCLIPDEDYMKLVAKEGNWRHMCDINNFSTCHYSLIEDLQNYHDNCFGEHNHLVEIAKRYNLTPYKSAQC